MRLEWRDENWRSKEMSVPLPKELVRLAWKAKVGYSCDNNLTHLACDGVSKAVHKVASKRVGQESNDVCASHN